MRAVAFNRTAAGLMGINPNGCALIAFALARPRSRASRHPDLAGRPACRPWGR
jgi:hypothetical protein